MIENSAPAPAVKLSPVQRAVLVALAAGEFVPVRTNKRIFRNACHPNTAIALHELGLVEAQERVKPVESGVARAQITGVKITPAGRVAVGAEPEEH